jgi:hypothetical protein
MHTIVKQALALSVLGALASRPPWRPATAKHRSSPGSPKVDGTDFYMFRSYEAGRSDFVTLIANYVPLQDAYGGPNYFAMDPNALYEIHIDNNGDAKEDLTFQFRFNNANKDTKLTVGGKSVSIPLVINGGAIAGVNAAGANVRETYTVSVVRGDRRTGTKAAVTNAAGGGATFDKPLDNIGNKSIPNYVAYAAKHVYASTSPAAHAGAHVCRPAQGSVRRQPGRDLRPGQHQGAGDRVCRQCAESRKDDLADKNVTTIEMEVTACLPDRRPPAATR